MFLDALAHTLSAKVLKACVKTIGTDPMQIPSMEVLIEFSAMTGWLVCFAVHIQNIVGRRWTKHLVQATPNNVLVESLHSTMTVMRCDQQYAHTK